MWHSIKVLLLLAGLAGCGEFQPGGRAVPAITMLGNTVAVQGPENYCVDRRLSRPFQGLAVMVSCARISESTDRPAIDGLITTQMGAFASAGVAGSERELATLLRTPDGAALLSSTSDAETVTLHRLNTSDGLVTIFFTDTSETESEGIGQNEWRAFLDLDNRLVTISVREFENARLSNRRGRRLLRSAIASFRAANAARLEEQEDS